jgi:hypothetical protein
MSETAPAPAPTPVPSSTPAPAGTGASDLLAAHMTPEAARAEIQAKIHEPGFLKKLKEDPAIDEIRTRATVTRAEHDWAAGEKDRMMRDAAWRSRFFNGDRVAKNEWHRVVQLSALPYVGGTP